MRVLVVGAGGAIGSQLVPQLAERGHQVTGTSRSAAKAAYLKSVGAEPAVLDVLDAAAVRATVAAARPDAIIYQATALTGIKCRCGTHTAIMRAVKRAADKMA